LGYLRSGATVLGEPSKGPLSAGAVMRRPDVQWRLLVLNPNFALAVTAACLETKQRLARKRNFQEEFPIFLEFT